MEKGKLFIRKTIKFLIQVLLTLYEKNIIFVAYVLDLIDPIWIVKDLYNLYFFYIQIFYFIYLL